MLGETWGHKFVILVWAILFVSSTSTYGCNTTMELIYLASYKKVPGAQVFWLLDVCFWATIQSPNHDMEASF